jgi:minor extracellular serine protease Vpr
MGLHLARAAVRRVAVVIALSSTIPIALAQFIPNRYALILEDVPIASRFSARAAARTAAAGLYRQQIEARQAALRAELAARQVQVTGSASMLVNAIFVTAPPDRVTELGALPGVRAVVPVRRHKLSLNRAISLVNAPAAWSALGGQANAGAGVRIAILDTGIDQTNPALQDSSLPMPSGFPLCNGDDCAFTSNKVIVARSYVRQLAAGSSLLNPAADSRPDDYSPRDREGHGTAIASVIAGVSNSGTVTFSGVAPKAYLGNYKIYGSPEVNDFSGDDVIILALEDAVKDGMDIVSFSTGSVAFTGPLDSGSACGLAPGVPCDLSAAAFEQAARSGMIIVAAAGNSGEDGLIYPTLNTVSSPANAPSVIAVGATTNSHTFAETVSVETGGAPSSLRGIAASPSYDAYSPLGAVSSPLVDVSTLGNDGLACTALPSGSLAGAFALIQRGTCDFSVKAGNAVLAGADGVVFYMATPEAPLYPSGLSRFSIPFAMVSQVDGLALKSFLTSSPGAPVTIDPNGAEQDNPNFNRLASFSSAGPSTGDSLLKPELVAPGTWMYMAAQNYDPLGFLYSSNRRAAADGTSFSTPLVAGAAALVTQRHPEFTAAEVKSVLVNTASQDVTTDNSTPAVPVGIQRLGAGKLDAGAAVSALVTSDPATVSFGVLRSGSLPMNRQLQITNRGTASVNLTVLVSSPGAGVGTNLAVDKTSLALTAGATTTLTVSLTGTLPLPGSYSGTVMLQATGVLLRIPYLFLVGSGSQANMIPLTGSSFDGTVGQGISEGIVSFRLVDAYGVPVSGVPVSWTPQSGIRLLGAESSTDPYGVAAAQPVLGLVPGNYSVTASAGRQTLTFSGSARLAPLIFQGGIVNAASFEGGTAVAPGSYVAIFGSGLSDTTQAAVTARLPLAIDYAIVSFDVPSAGISVPGHLTYASMGQVNVQVPWELQGQSAAQVKVSIFFSNGNVVTVPLADYAPAFFETSPGVVAALDAGNQVISILNRAVRGQPVQLFANGLGPVANQPASGEPALLSPLSETRTVPVVTIGGRNAVVSWSGLTPTLAGLYQINVTVPPDLAPGTHQITVTIGGKTSKISNLPVR